MKQSTLGELIADTVTHGIGALLSVIGLILIIIKANTFTGYLAGIIYGICLIFLYVSSTLFHAFPENFRRTRAVFQRLDHSGVFLLIVGTYTPIILMTLPLVSAIIFLSIMWALAITGIVFKSIWIKRFKGIHLAIYLIMGWSVVIVWRDIYPLIETDFWLIFSGGLAYTLGVVFYLAPFKYNHFIWHLFVMAGSFLHYLFIYQIL
ncbi:MAG TPA: hemolysin III family protein [Candidatus Izemoplasmatales bacterium]|nr:hemolysin III family protein [Candidatus Izemoplasmatales bacterium]